MPIDKSIKRNGPRKRPLILISNDDGVYSKGIRTLARYLKRIGRVIIVAPDQERSAASHALTLHRPLRVKKMAKDFYAVDGTPTDCINLGINEIIKETPDLIVSGINRGGNLGDDVHYSGTVSAALEGGLMGVPSIAISVAGGERCLFEPAAKFAVRLAKKVLKEGLPAGVILNVNVPNLAAPDIKGHVFTGLGKRNYDKIIVEKIDPRGNKYYWIGGEDAGFENLPHTDCMVLSKGFISITPLKVRITDTSALKTLKKWRLDK